MAKQRLESVEYYATYRADPWNPPEVAHRDADGYLMRCIAHHKLSCPACEKADGVVWERAAPGCHLNQSTVMEDAAKLDDCCINGNYGDWSIAGKLRVLWLRDLKFILSAGDADAAKERIQSMVDEAERTKEK